MKLGLGLGLGALLFPPANFSPFRFFLTCLFITTYRVPVIIVYSAHISGFPSPSLQNARISFQFVFPV